MEPESDNVNDYYYQINDQFIRRDIIDNYYEPVQTDTGIQLVRTDLIEPADPQLGIGPLVVPLIGAATTLVGGIFGGVTARKNRKAAEQQQAVAIAQEQQKMAEQKKLLFLGIGGAGLLLATYFLLKRK